MEVSGIRFETDGLGAALAGIGRFNEAVDGIGGGIGRAAADFSASEQIIIGGLRRIGAGAVEVAAQLGTQFAQGIGSTVSLAGDFEATVTRFSAVTGDALAQSGQDVEDFSSLFLKLGAETQYSAQQAAEAGVNLAKGGIDPATVAAGGLNAALTLAASGELDLAVAAEITAKQYGVWTQGMTNAADRAAFLAQSSDRLAQAANASTVDVAELALGLSQVSGVARVMGYDFDETVTIMAQLAPAFGSASDAGTSWKAVINNLIPTTKDAKQTMQELGLYTKESGSAFFDAQGNFVGARDAAELLRQATANLSEEQKSLALETIFGSDGQRAAAIIAEQGAAGYDKMRVAMDGAGTASEQAAARQVGLNFAMEQLGGSVETLQIVLGQKLIPYLVPLIDLATQGTNVLLAFAQGSDDAGTQLYGFVDAIDAIIPGFQEFFYSAADTLSWLGDLAVDAYNYGVGIAASFADGIASAVSFVADALGAIGDTISYWLEPHSPPNIVPDLDRWGADAINVYLDGWTQGDFSIFESIGSLISSQLRSIADQAGSAIPRDGLIPMILGTRSAVAEAIEQLQETGEIGAEAYQKIRDAAGPAGETIAGMLELLVEQVDATKAVEEAQDAYNATVEEFATRLGELKAERDRVNESYENTPIDQAIAINEEQQRQIRDAEKAAKLQETINDESKSEAERRKAQLELERMQLEIVRRQEEKARDEALAGIDQQISATEQERDTAVDAAQQKLDEAKIAKESIDAEVQARQSLIKTQQDQNALVREQVQLLQQMAKEAEQAAKAAAKAAKAGSKAGGGKAGGAKKPKPAGGGRVKKPEAPIIGRPQGAPQGTRPGETSTPTAPAGDTRNRRLEELNNIQEPDVDWLGRLQTQSMGVQAALAGVATIIGAAVIPAIVSAAGAFAIAAAPLVALGAAGALLYTAWSTDFLGIQGVVDTVIDGIGSSLGGAVTAFQTTRAEGGTFWESLVAGAQAGAGAFMENLPGMIDAVGGFFGRLIDYAFENVPKWAAALTEFGIKAVSWVYDRLPALYDSLGQMFNTMVNWVLDRAPAWGASLADFGAKAIGWVLDALPGLGTNLGTMAGTILGWIVTTIADAVPKLIELGGKFFGWIAETVIPALPGALATIGEAITNFVTSFADEVVPHLSKLGTRFLDWVNNDVVPFLAERLAMIVSGIVSWVDTAVTTIRSTASRIGQNVVDGIQAGISAAWGRFTAWIDSKINEIPQAIRDALGINSPSTVIWDIMEWVPKTAIMVFDEYAPVLQKSVTDLFDIGGSIGSFASKIVDRFKREFIDPLQDLIKQTEEESKTIGDDLSNIDSERSDLLKAIANASTDDERRIGQQRLAELEQRRTTLAQKQLDAQKRQSQLQQQANVQQKQLFALEKQRQQLEMFKAQQDLIDSLKEYGLDPRAILGDTPLGGDPAQLLEAMRRAQAAILAKLGLNFGGGEIGITGNMAALTNPPGAKATYVTNNGNTNVFNIDARGSNWTEAQFQKVVERTINGSVQGARTLRTMNA